VICLSAARASGGLLEAAWHLAIVELMAITAATQTDFI